MPRSRFLSRLRPAPGTALVLGLATSVALAAGPLHVPSPDWRDQVIYFLMTDRFDDGDPGNNRQGEHEYRPGSPAHYQGGDLRGVTRRVDYLQGLGATAVWITPPVANQWWDGEARYGGYHGYWAEHFTEVDRHLGTLADYQDLARTLHGRGMYLVQDIVLNHTGNFFDIGTGWKDGRPAGDPVTHWRAHRDSHPSPAPRQAPFHLNDPRDPAHRAAGIYHWTPGIQDYRDRRQELHGQMSGLDDLNTGNPVVRRALRQSYAHWIREAGVDAFRVDTAFYVPETLFEDFLNARDPLAPGIRTVARQTGRRDFLVFGEGFGIDAPGQTTQARRIQAYMDRGPGGRRMDGMLNFPLYGALNEVFARGQAPDRLARQLRGMRALHPRWHWMPSFVDNHDVDRFLAGGSEAGLRQALLAVMTLPGIPTLYYGTEQGFAEPRASMFAAGHGSGGRDRFDTQAPLYRQIAAMSELRRSHRLFTRGWPTVLHGNAQGPGALAWRMDHAGPQGGSALVVFNTADHPVLLDHLATGLPAGRRLQGRYGLDGPPADLRLDAAGQVTLSLPPRSGQVWLLTPAAAADAAPRTATRTATAALVAPATPAGASPGAHHPVPPPAPAADRSAPLAPPQLDALPAAPVGAVLTLRGRSAPQAGPLQLVVNGNLGQALSVQPGPDGHWQAELPTGDLLDEQVTHRVVAWRPQDGRISAARPFRVRHQWQPLADLSDPAGDDLGPDGRYRRPTDPSYAPPTMDLRRVQVESAAGALRLHVQLGALSRVWNPAHGFDHLALTVFLELPGQPGGQTVAPLQNTVLPDGMRWHRRLRLHGWSNATFTDAGSSATHEGQALSPGAHLTVDPARQRLTLTLPASSLGHAPLEGARLWLNTWDWDGGYRALTPEPQGHGFGGGDGQRDPLWLDASEVVRLGR